MKKLYISDLIVPMNEKPILIDGYFSVGEGLIRELGKAENFDIKNTEVVKLKNSLVLPGLINSHIHLAYERNFAEVKKNEQLQWMKNLIMKSRPQTSEHKQKVAKLNLKKVLRSGTTCLVENTPFEETVHEIASSPLRALIGWEVFGNNSSEASKIFENAIMKINEFEAKYLGSQISFTLSPHTIYNVSGDLLQLINNWAKENHRIWLTHLAEFEFESELTERGFSGEKLKEFHETFKFANPNLNGLKNQTPVTYLNKIGCLNQNLLATHLVKATATDIQLLTDKGVKIVSCPGSNSYLLNGRIDLERMFQSNLLPSIATDGLSSNFRLDLLTEIQTAWQIHRSHGLNISAKYLWHAITSIPGKQLGFNNGSLEADKVADFIVFELKPEQIEQLKKLNEEEIYNFMLSELNSSMITQVYIGGVIQETD